MNNFIEVLIKELITGINISFKNSKYVLGKENENILKDILNCELAKPSIEQSRTPTQIVNEFLEKEFNESFALTPANFGEKAHELIIEWGVQKVKEINEQ